MSLGALDQLHVYVKHDVELMARLRAVQNHQVNSYADREIAEGISLARNRRYAHTAIIRLNDVAQLHDDSLGLKLHEERFLHGVNVILSRQEKGQRVWRLPVLKNHLVDEFRLHAGEWGSNRRWPALDVLPSHPLSTVAQHHLSCLGFPIGAKFHRP